MACNESNPSPAGEKLDRRSHLRWPGSRLAATASFLTGSSPADANTTSLAESIDDRRAGRRP
jgi:hypothetical protein